MGLIGKSADRLSLTWTDSDFFILARALFEPTVIFFLPVTDFGRRGLESRIFMACCVFLPEFKIYGNVKFTSYLEVEILQLLLLLDVQIVIRPGQRSGIPRTGLSLRWWHGRRLTDLKKLTTSPS